MKWKVLAILDTILILLLIIVMATIGYKAIELAQNFPGAFALEDAGRGSGMPTPHGFDGTPWSPTTVDATPTPINMEDYPCLTCETLTPISSSYPTEEEGLPMCRKFCTALEATKLHWHGNPMICECYYEFQGAWAWRIVWMDRKEKP